MKTICLYFQIHQPFRLKRYRFFDIGNDHYYYDEYSNRAIMRKVADKCYLPANKILLDLINENKGKFKVSFSITGIVMEQFQMYAPEVLESFKQLAKTGCVEFLAETYSHSLSSLKSKKEFTNQVLMHKNKVKEIFGLDTKVFRNTELIYDDGIGEMVAEMGFSGMLTEGAKHILGWKSPNYIYANSRNPKLRILLKNYKLSDDIAFRFSNRSWSEYPLTCEKFVGWLNAIPADQELVNLFLDYETFGEHQWAESGIFEFLKAFPQTVFSHSNYTFSKVSEVIENTKEFQTKALLHVPHPISWADEERDLSAWLGNELQNDAFNKLYEISDLVSKVKDPLIQRDWRYLQTSDHFYYMCTKFFSDGDVHRYFNPFGSPYDAFINYMNVLSDFIDRVRKAEIEEDVENKIKEYEEEILRLKSKLKTKTNTPKVKVETKVEMVVDNSVEKIVEKNKEKAEENETSAEIVRTTKKKTQTNTDNKTDENTDVIKNQVKQTKTTTTMAKKVETKKAAEKKEPAKTTTKKPAVKSAVKKDVKKAAPATKATVKKVADAKPKTTKKAVEKKPVEKKAAEKKPVAKKAAEKKPVAKKAAEKKPVAKKVVAAKKPAVKKPAAKK